ncbi:MAG: CDP-glycerol glycerophosphotransferase family protein [Elusimicrobia bacterium]|nr:CDP-glycerol glycerophosphotransferase family protein [Elusimicrobiota bacterium]
MEKKEDKYFNDSAELIKSLNEIKIEGITITEYLKFKEVSLWELMVPFLACCSFPSAFSQANQEFNIINSCKHLFHKKIKPYLKCIRDFVRDINDKKNMVEYENMDKKKNALFLVFEPRHYKEIYSPLKEILVKRDIGIRTICSKYRAAQEKFAKEDTLFIEDFYNMDMANQVKKNNKEISVKLKKVKTILVSKIKNTYPGIWNYFRDELDSIFIWEFSSLIKQITIAHEVIDKIKPDIIAGGDDCDPRARIYFLIGRNRKTPTLLIQQGYASDNAFEWLFLSVDKAAIFGNYTKQCLEKIGVKKEKLVISGQPRFDSLVKITNEREIVCNKYNIQSKNKIILFTSQPNHPGAFSSETVRRNAIETVYSLIDNITDAVLIVKPHPDEKMQYHRSLKLKNNTGKIILVDRRDNLYELIKACDLLITFFSTTAIEAMISNKPVLIVNLFNRWTPYVESGAALQACSGNEAVSVINDIFSNNGIRQELENKRKKFVVEHAYNLDGNASGRVVDLMFEMMKN